MSQVSWAWAGEKGSILLAKVLGSKDKTLSPKQLVKVWKLLSGVVRVTDTSCWKTSSLSRSAGGREEWGSRSRAEVLL